MQRKPSKENPTLSRLAKEAQEALRLETLRLSKEKEKVSEEVQASKAQNEFYIKESNKLRMETETAVSKMEEAQEIFNKLYQANIQLERNAIGIKNILDGLNIKVIQKRQELAQLEADIAVKTPVLEEMELKRKNAEEEMNNANSTKRSLDAEVVRICERLEKAKTQGTEEIEKVQKELQEKSIDLYNADKRIETAKVYTARLNKWFKEQGINFKLEEK